MEETTAGAAVHARTQGAGAAASFFRRLLPAYCDAGMLLGALILTWFPLRGDYLKKVQADVLALHAQKHAQLPKG